MRLSDYKHSEGRGQFRRDRKLFLNSGTWTWTIPDGVTKVWAFCMGAGGGGPTYGTANTNNFGVLGGGKGGGYASGIISGLTPGNTLTLTIGAGGLGSYRGATARNGGNTTVAATGGTTYLTGNGGGGGSNTPVTSDNGSQKGSGGGASTSGVTDAYTASGGGSGNYPAGVGTTGGIGTDCSVVTGGGASGSPFGTGMGGGRAVATEKCPTGGGGWCQKEYPHAHGVHNGSGEFRMEGGEYPGYGSHDMPFFYNKGASKFYSVGGTGGRGRSAKGGLSMSMASMFGSYFDSVNGPGMGNYAKMADLLDGEDGNPNWWFPWEVDGGGGGATYHTNSYGSWHVPSGNGGPGAGGGAVSGYGSNQCICKAGRGGFGGGGGGARVSSTNINYWVSSVGGNGGNGGGGGGAWGRIQSGRYMPVGGDGGDGAVGIYW